MSQARLTTLDTLKELLKDVIPAGYTGDDANLDIFINITSSAIESYLDRGLAAADYDLRLQPTYRDILRLPHYPVTAVTLVRHGEEVLGTDDYRLEDGGAGGVLVLDRGVWHLPVRVIFEAGYVLPGETGRDLPFDIEYACLLWCQQMYSLGPRVGVKQERIDDISVSYESPFSLYVSTSGRPYPAPPAIMALLNPYRRLL